MSIKQSPKIKQALVSLVVLLIFIIPSVLSVQWMHDVIMGKGVRAVEAHKVYTEEQIAAFQDANSVRNTARQLEPFEEPVISITFDDGWESIYSKGFPVLEEYEIDSTQYILGNHFPEAAYMSEAQVRSMQINGHEIASHTMTHPDLTKLSTEDLDWELRQSASQLSDEFGSVRDFATPLGAYNDAVLQRVRAHYRSHRNTAVDPVSVDDIDINVRETFDPYQINAYTVRNTTKLDDIKRLIDYTVKRKGWLVITYHQIDDSDLAYAVSEQTLRSQLQLIQDSGARTASVGQFLNAHERAKATDL